MFINFFTTVSQISYALRLLWRVGRNKRKDEKQEEEEEEE